VKRGGGCSKTAPPAASWAHENVSAVRRLFFFCRRAADFY